MNVSLIVGIVVGAALAALALPAYRLVSERIRQHRAAGTLAVGQVTTVGQVLHLVAQGSPTGVAVVDRSGEVILSNGRAHELGLIHERTVNPRVWATALEVYEDQEQRDIELTEWQRRPGSRVISVRAEIKPLTLVDPRFMVVYATDESEHVRMESARRDFVANVSHELKTPVGGMALLAEALTESKDDPDSVEYFGTKLQREAKRMADMIRELIALSKLQGAEALPDMVPVGVDEVIAEAIARNQVTADNAGIKINRGADSGVAVNGDKQLLVTAMANLISNAINYSPQATPVSITQKTPGDGMVQIRVTDRGIGIDEEDQQRVFERFFRADKARSRSTGGTGLGLAIVKHVAANHGGEIRLWSRPGTGSTFTLVLPIWEPNQEPVPPQELTGSLPEASKPARVVARRKEKDRNS